MTSAEGTGWGGFWMMLVMICAAALLLLLTSATESHAMARARAGASAIESGVEAPGALSCTYEHVGVEDHWQGHSSCSECLSEHHECETKCYTTAWSCVAKGTATSGVSIRSFGRSDAGQNAAAEDAVKKCRMSGSQKCEIESCEELSLPFSRTAC